MIEDFFPESRPARPIWLVTLADLALLLLGFFVLVQANQKRDFQALAAGLRAGFGVRSAAPAGTSPKPAPSPLMPADPMPVAIADMPGFAPGSAVLPGAPDRIARWARDQLADPRLLLKITGSVDGTAADVDPATGIGSLLAADRARAVAVALVSARMVPANRLILATDTGTGGRRAVMLTVAFAGDRP